MQFGSWIREGKYSDGGSISRIPQEMEKLMPPLSKTLRSMSPEGFAAQEELPASLPKLKDPGRVLGANPFIRCPLPPFNSSPDSLRQFEENGKIPARRVIPLPAAVSAGGSTVINNNTTVTNIGGSSSSGSTTVTAKTVTFNAPILFPGNAATATITLSKVAVLLICGASDLCEVRIYGDPITQTADIARATDTAPAFEVTAGLVSDIVFDSTPLNWNWQNRVFVNQDSPATTNLYITVINNTLGTVTPSVTITYLPLE